MALVIYAMTLVYAMTFVCATTLVYAMTFVMQRRMCKDSCYAMRRVHYSVWCVTLLILMCDVTHCDVWHYSFWCGTLLILMCGFPDSDVWRDSLRCVTILVLMCDITHSNMMQYPFFYVTWLIAYVQWLVCMQWHLLSNDVFAKTLVMQCDLSFMQRRLSYMQWLCVCNDICYTMTYVQWRLLCNVVLLCNDTCYAMTYMLWHSAQEWSNRTVAEHACSEM